MSATAASTTTPSAASSHQAEPKQTSHGPTDPCLRCGAPRPGNSYSLLERNCNHFSDQLCRSLVQRPAPRYINRLAGLGQRLSCILPQELT